tara:strand:- start:974 stop:1297 length:324 start_codon:yes stop_codon:yes gene_type:complete
MLTREPIQAWISSPLSKRRKVLKLMSIIQLRNREENSMMSNEDCELENLKVENQKLGKQIEFLKRSLEKAVKQGLEEIERRQFAELEVTKIKKEMKISLNDIRKSGL